MRVLDRVSELDGIRGVAILLVMIFHFGVFIPMHPTVMSILASQAFVLGWCGVDLFFVLSGFLITGILLDSKSSVNYFSVFYERRALRILPLYYLAVFLFFWIIPVAAHRFGWFWTEISSTEQLWYWLHISNWRTAFNPSVYPIVGHFWSLAIEEQFYLVWPLLVLNCSPRRLLLLSACVILGCGLARNLPAVQVLAAQYPNMLYRLTPFRVDTLLFGACAALIIRDERWAARVRRYMVLAFASGCVIVAAVVAVARTTSAHSVPMTRFGYTALGLTCASAVLYATWHTGSSGVVARILRGRVLTSFGKYSYAMYVFHVPLISLVHVHRFPAYVSFPLTILLRIGATYLVALLSWNCVERHFLKLKSQFRYSSIALVDKVEALRPSTMV
jgi:peptidoglycan/LPS O-acetylase OafA/YrhL